MIKQLANAAGVGIHFIRSDEDLKGFTRLNLKANRFACFDLLIERHVDGPIYTIDGIYHNGEIIFTAGSRYINFEISKWAYDQPSESSYVTTLDEGTQAFTLLKKANEKMLSHVDKRDSFVFHSEFFIEHGRPLLCETARRPPGALMTEMHREARGVELRQWAIHQSVDTTIQPFDETQKKHGLIQFKALGSKPLIINNMPLNCELPGVYAYHAYQRKGERIDPISFIDSFYHLLTLGHTEKDAMKVALNVEKWFVDCSDVYYLDA